MKQTKREIIFVPGPLIEKVKRDAQIHLIKMKTAAINRVKLNYLNFISERCI